MTIQELESKILQAGIMNHKLFLGGGDKSNTGNYHMEHNYKEFALLCEYLLGLDKNFKTYLEIGPGAGGTTRFLTELLSFETICLVDMFSPPKFWNQFSQARPHIAKMVKRLEQFRGNSSSFDCYLHMIQWGIKFDLAYLDGDRNERGVMYDVALTNRHLKIGGLLCIHDVVACAGVKNVVNKLKKGGSFKHLCDFVSNPKPLGISVFEKVI